MNLSQLCIINFKPLFATILIAYELTNISVTFCKKLGENISNKKMDYEFAVHNKTKRNPKAIFLHPVDGEEVRKYVNSLKTLRQTVMFIFQIQFSKCFIKS